VARGRAGQLGPWAGLVGRVGIAPESTGMKCAFVVFGALWITCGLGALVVVLLLTPTMRAALGRG
jgi:hypothetical protein